MGRNNVESLQQENVLGKLSSCHRRVKAGWLLLMVFMLGKASSCRGVIAGSVHGAKIDCAINVKNAPAQNCLQTLWDVELEHESWVSLWEVG